MNTEIFLKAYNESRNGANNFVRNPLYPSFLYSDGVQSCAEAGCYWLLDIFGTELPGVFKTHPEEPLLIVTVNVSNSKAVINGSFSDGANDYLKQIDYTDMPEGDWTFYVGNDGDGVLRCILPSEY